MTEVAYARKLGRKRARRARQHANSFARWANLAPYTFLCRQHRLEAEIADLAGNHATALPSFINVIATARESGFVFIALANECAGKHLLRLDRKDKMVCNFLRASVTAYDEWGAMTKAQHLRDELRRSNLGLDMGM